MYLYILLIYINSVNTLKAADAFFLFKIAILQLQKL